MNIGLEKIVKTEITARRGLQVSALRAGVGFGIGLGLGYDSGYLLGFGLGFGLGFESEIRAEGLQKLCHVTAHWRVI